MINTWNPERNSLFKLIYIFFNCKSKIKIGWGFFVLFLRVILMSDSPFFPGTLSGSGSTDELLPSFLDLAFLKIKKTKALYCLRQQIFPLTNCTSKIHLEIVVTPILSHS